MNPDDVIVPIAEEEQNERKRREASSNRMPKSLSI